MDVHPFHHQNLFFNIITDYDLTFQEIREILDYLLKAEAFSGGDDALGGGKFYDIKLGSVQYEVDVHRLEVVIYRRVEIEG